MFSHAPHIGCNDLGFTSYYCWAAIYNYQTKYMPTVLAVEEKEQKTHKYLA